MLNLIFDHVFHIGLALVTYSLYPKENFLFLKQVNKVKSPLYFNDRMICSIEDYFAVCFVSR